MKTYKPRKKTQRMTVYRSPRTSTIDKPIRTKLVYTDTILLTSSGSVPFNTWTFRANSVFDPDYTAVSGHQPYRFDQLAAIYGRYEVISSKIRVQFTTGDKAHTTTALGPWHVGVATSNSATPAGVGADPGYSLAETTRADHGALCGQMIRQCKAKWDQSLTGNNEHDTSLVAATNGNPGAEGFYIVWAFNEGQVIATDVLAHVRIEYDVRFSRPIQAAIS